MGLSPILFHNIDVDLELKDSGHLATWLTQVADIEGFFIGKLQYHFCSDEHLLQMNRDHLDHDYYTDVITFDDSRHPLLSGDVFISIDRVSENAVELEEEFTVELSRVMVHGLLHLMGYGDKDEAEKALMREKEMQALRLLH